MTHTVIMTFVQYALMPCGAANPLRGAFPLWVGLGFVSCFSPAAEQHAALQPCKVFTASSEFLLCCSWLCQDWFLYR